MSSKASTLSTWLAARRPEPPGGLARHIELALIAGAESARDAAGEPTPEWCLASAERLLRELLEDGRSSRDAALDLLTADALVTYAFELAADAPALVEARAEQAMRSLATLADGSESLRPRA